MNSKVKRPILRYHGGKWRLAPWIISYFPEHRFYIEPFGGVASVLLRKPRSFSEVYNDLDGDLVNLLTVLRDEHQRIKLIEQLKLTPFSRDEFERAVEPSDDVVENARRTIVRSFMGYGSAATNKNHITGFRSRSHRTAATAGRDWLNYPAALHQLGERLRGVIIERRDALSLIEYHDNAEALFYIDPPYIHETRHQGSERCYVHDMSVAEHEKLLEKILQLEGQVVISGYEHELYCDYLKGWKKETRAAAIDGKGKRIEVLWIKDNSRNEKMRQGAYFVHKKRTSHQELIIKDAIENAKKENRKITKSYIASIVGISREHLGRRYSHLFEKV